jgi:hypothetical protein
MSKAKLSKLLLLKANAAYQNLNPNKNFWKYISSSRKSEIITKGVNKGIVGETIHIFDQNNKPIKVYFKKLEAHQAISEIICSRLYQLFEIPASESFLAKGNLSIDGKLINEESVYTGSILLDDFYELYKVFQTKNKKAKYKTRPASIDEDDIKRIKKYFLKINNNSLEKCIIGALLLKDKDLHTGNIGAIIKDNKLISFVKIDHDWGLASLDDELKPFKTEGINRINLNSKRIGPKNNISEFARDKERGVFINPGFIHEIDNIIFKRITEYQIRQVVNECLNEAENFFDIKDFKEFAKKIGTKFSAKEDINEIKKTIGKHIAVKLENRIKALKNFRSELSIDLSIQQNNDGEYYVDKKILKDVIMNNPSFFQNRNKFHFRNHYHKENYKQLSELLIPAVKEIQEELKPKTNVERCKIFFNKIINFFIELGKNVKSIIGTHPKPPLDNTKLETKLIKEDIKLDKQKPKINWLKKVELPFGKNISKNEIE